MEAVQGEGGYHPMSPATAQKIRKLTRERGILLVADEIQSGMGRTGEWFAFQRLGIEPDIVVFGKAVGGGMPLAGFAASRELMEKWSPGEHGTTFGGNPIACAAGLAALRTIERDGLVDAARPPRRAYQGASDAADWPLRRQRRPRPRPDAGARTARRQRPARLRALRNGQVGSPRQRPARHELRRQDRRRERQLGIRLIPP